MFNPPNDLIGSFNVDCSFGLVEHFADTVDAIKACSKFAKPDGFDLPPVTLPVYFEKSPFKNHVTCLSFCAYIAGGIRPQLL